MRKDTAFLVPVLYAVRTWSLNYLEPSDGLGDLGWVFPKNLLADRRAKTPWPL